MVEAVLRTYCIYICLASNVIKNCKRGEFTQACILATVPHQSVYLWEQHRNRNWSWIGILYRFSGVMTRKSCLFSCPVNRPTYPQFASCSQRPVFTNIYYYTIYFGKATTPLTFSRTNSSLFSPKYHHVVLFRFWHWTNESTASLSLFKIMIGVTNHPGSVTGLCNFAQERQIQLLR